MNVVHCETKRRAINNKKGVRGRLNFFNEGVERDSSGRTVVERVEENIFNIFIEGGEFFGNNLVSNASGKLDFKVKIREREHLVDKPESLKDGHGGGTPAEVRDSLDRT